MKDVEIGTITHYYDKIKVAVVRLKKGDLKVGDNIKLTKNDGSEFTQTVGSMQIEHAVIEIAKAGDEFGLEVDHPVKPKTAVVKIK